MKILFLEENSATRLFLADRSNREYDIITAGSVEEAKKILAEQEPIDVVVFGDSRPRLNQEWYAFAKEMPGPVIHFSIFSKGEIEEEVGSLKGIFAKKPNAERLFAAIQKCKALCKECGEEIDLLVGVPLMTGCGGCGLYDTAFVCKKCGRLHWDTGSRVFNRSGEAAYLECGAIITKRVPAPG